EKYSPCRTKRQSSSFPSPPCSVETSVVSCSLFPIYCSLSLQISLGHPLPPRPVMSGIIAPYFEPHRHTLIAQNVREALIIAPALVMHASREHISIAPHQIQRMPVVQVR